MSLDSLGKNAVSRVGGADSQIGSEGVGASATLLKRSGSVSSPSAPVKTPERGVESVESSRDLGSLEKSSGRIVSLRPAAAEFLTAFLGDQGIKVVDVKAVEKTNMTQKMNEIINQVEKIKESSPEDHQNTKEILNTVSDAIELLSDSPAGSENIKKQQTVIQNLLEKMEDLKDQIQGFEEVNLNDDAPVVASKKPVLEVKDVSLQGMLLNVIEGQISTLKEKNAYIDLQRINNPSTMKDVAQAKKMWTESALNLLNEKIAEFKAEKNMDSALPKNPKDVKALAEMNKTKGILEARIQMFSEVKEETAITGKNAIKDLMGDKKAGFFSKKGAVNKTVKEFKESGDIRFSSKNLREQDMLKEVLKETFKNAGIKGVDLKEGLEHKHIEILNKQDWQPIKKEVKISLGDGALTTFKSNITPAAHIGEADSRTFASYNGKGVSCATSFEKVHAVNLATTEFANDQGKVLFRGLRHGIHSAFGLTDPAERVTANKSRAEETIKAAIVADPKKLEEALRTGKLTLDLTSISLVTPDVFRGSSKDPMEVRKVGKANERTMLAEQIRAWQEFDGKETTMTIKDKQGNDREIKVTADILAFNFGVNAGAVNWYSGVAGGWGTSDEINKKAMERLLGAPNKNEEVANALLETGLIDQKEGKAILAAAKDNSPDSGGKVGRHLARLDERIRETADPSQKAQLEKDKRIISELSSQIKDIWSTEAYKTSGPDPYKMVSRIAVLTHMMDNTAAFNCKSGKDRTGELDVEAKFLAMQIELTGRVPPFDKKLDAKETTMFREIALNTGNLEMQKYNVSAGGFKLEGVDAITERLGGKDAKEVHRGLSKHFES